MLEIEKSIVIADVFKKIIKIATIDIFAKATSLIILLILPKILSLTDYSYVQLYYFYLGYTGILHFGLIDGLYLRVAGTTVEKLDKILYSNIFLLFFGAVTIISIVIIFLTSLFVEERDVKIVSCLALISCVFLLGRSYLLCIFQCTNQIDLFAKNSRLDSYVYFILTIIAVLVGERDYIVFIVLDNIAKFISFLICFKDSTYFEFRILLISKKIIHELINNIKVGVFLMLANLAGLLLIGVYRFFIEKYFGIEIFGKLSLVLQFINLSVLLFSSTSVVLYAALKQNNISNQINAYKNIRTKISVISPLIIVTIYPVIVLINIWLPKYVDSISFIIVLYPLCVYLGRQTILLNTFLRIFRLERAMLIINFSCLLLNIIIICILHSLGFGIYYYLYLMLLVVIIQVNILEVIVARKIEKYDLSMTICYQIPIICFIFLSSILQFDLMLAVYLSILLLFYFFVKKNLTNGS